MSDNGRISVLFLLNLLLYFLAGEFNFYLTQWSVYLHLDALLIVFFGLYVSRTSSLVFTALLGCLADAMNPAPGGTYLIGYICLWMYFVWCQRRIRRQNSIHVRAVTAVGQLLWMGVLLAVAGTAQWGSLVYWGRILAEVLLSAVVVYLLAWPWCRFQKQFLYSLGWDLEALPPPH